MEESLSTIIKWMKGSGLKVNEDKTEICLFYRTPPPIIILKIGIQGVFSTHSIIVLLVIFDATMKWSNQIESTLKKANSARFVIKMIPKFFNKNELNDIITACYYSILSFFIAIMCSFVLM